MSKKLECPKCDWNWQWGPRSPQDEFTCDMCGKDGFVMIPNTVVVRTCADCPWCREEDEGDEDWKSYCYHPGMQSGVQISGNMPPPAACPISPGVALIVLRGKATK